MKLRFILFSMICFLTINGVFSQTEDFTKEAFIDELKTFFGKEIKNDKNFKLEYETFIVNWSENKFNETEKDSIVSIANLMKTKRATPTPYYRDYIMVLNGFIATGKMNEYLKWNVFYTELLNTKRQTLTKLKSFLAFSVLLINDNIISKTKSATWFTEERSFEIQKNRKTEKLEIKFDNEFDLYCENRTEIFSISGTQGTYYPNEMKWVGENGRVSWQRQIKVKDKKTDSIQLNTIGFNEDEVYAEIVGRYVLNLKTGKFIIDSVLFTNTNYNQSKILGKLENNLTNKSNATKLIYPKFYSYENVEINNIFPEIDYVGGFSMFGEKFSGIGTENKKATLTIKKKGNDFLESESLLYSITENEINSNGAKVKLKFATTDSITHTNIRLNYKTKLSGLDINMYPDINNIDKNTALLSLIGPSNSTLSIPFIDSYHAMNIYASEIVWKQNDSILYVRTSSETRDKYAVFESSDYFSIEKFQKYDEVGGGFNHLIAIERLTLSKEKDFKYAVNSLSFLLKDYTLFLNYHYKKNYSFDQIHFILLDLESDGFLNYNTTNKKNLCTVNQKLYDIIQYRTKYKIVNRGKDFDNIEITSQYQNTSKPWGTNAIINLKNLDMNIIQLYPVWLSRGKNVAIETEQLTVKKNREMKFSGTVYAGDIKFDGAEFVFDYDKFEIDIRKEAKIEVLAKIYERDADGNKLRDPNDTTKFLFKKEKLKSKIEEIKGIIKIDDSENKSGTKINEGYPSFASRDTARVYYNETVDKSYSKEKFYFENYGLSIDSLNNITDKTIQLDGNFKSSVFPDLWDTLSIGSDKVLGLETDSDGLPVHNGRYYGKLTLNGGGLTGSGTVKYLTTTAKFDHFQVYPDTIVGATTSFVIEKLKEKDAPEVKGAKSGYSRVDIGVVDYKWNLFYTDTINYPDDNIVVKDKNVKYYTSKGESYRKEKAQFKMYENTLLDGISYFTGTIDIKPTGAVGSGDLEFIDAVIISDTINFEASRFDSPNAKFILKDKNVDTKINLFEVDSINTDIDIDKKLGVFKANSDDSKIYFPAYFYECEMDHFLWFINSKRLAIGAGGIPDLDTNLYAKSRVQRDSLRDAGQKDARMYGAKLISNDTKNKEEDRGLTFPATSAEYIMDSTTIVAKNVGDILIADAIIHPTSHIRIRPKGKVEKLDSVTIDVRNFADSVFIEHHFFDASAKIIHKNQYEADGSSIYPYLSHELYFHNIYIFDSTNVSIANATYKNFNDTIALNENFIFRGQGSVDDIILTGNKQNLHFKGTAQIVHTCSNIKAQKFDFNSEINPDSVLIPVGEIKNEKIRLNAGFYMSSKKNEDTPYGTFLTPLNDRDDSQVLSSEGFIYFDKNDGYFKIGSIKKLANNDTLGNLIQFNHKNCIIIGEGKLNFNIDLGEAKYEVVGTAIRSIASKQSFNTMVGFSFYYPENLMKEIVEEILMGANEDFDLSSEAYERNLKIWLGEEKEEDALQIITEINNGLNDEIPKEFKIQTFMFSKVEFNWDSTRNSFVSEGKLGVSNIYGKIINKQVEGVIEIRKSPVGDEVRIYIEPYPDQWYYFYIINNDLLVASSNDDYTRSITDMKKKDKKKGKFRISGSLDKPTVWLKNINYKQ